MPDCYKEDCLLRVNYASNIYGCENATCEQRVGLNTSHVSEEEKKQFRDSFMGKNFTFRMVPDSEQRLEQEPAERYDPMEYIWKSRKKWAVKFQCNTDGSTICFGYVCPKCMAESDEPLDQCPQCGAELKVDSASNSESVIDDLIKRISKPLSRNQEIERYMQDPNNIAIAHLVVKELDWAKNGWKALGGIGF